jgi:hypothetical protein
MKMLSAGEFVDGFDNDAKETRACFDSQPAVVTAVGCDRVQHALHQYDAGVFCVPCTSMDKRGARP